MLKFQLLYNSSEILFAYTKTLPYFCMNQHTELKLLEKSKCQISENDRKKNILIKLNLLQLH